MLLDPSMPVLVVDDDPIMTEIAVGIVRSVKFTDVDSAADGMIALQMLRERSYGLVLADLHMLPMDGLQLLKAVRAEAGLRQVPFILMTASTDTEKVRLAKIAGVDHYLLKPFRPHQLAEKIMTIRRLAARQSGVVDVPLPV